MSEHNKESHYRGNVPMMADLRKHLELLHPGNRGPSTSAIRENLANFSLIEPLEVEWAATEDEQEERKQG